MGRRRKRKLINRRRRKMGRIEKGREEGEQKGRAGGR